MLPRPCLDTRRDESGVLIVTPHLPHDAGAMHIRTLLDFFLSMNGIHDFVAWYYTPMALEFSGHLRPAATIYDCMDELSAFAGAPAGIREKERASPRPGRSRLDGRSQSVRSQTRTPRQCPGVSQ